MAIDRRWMQLVAVGLWLAASPVGAQRAASASGDSSELEVEARARFQLGQLYYSQARFAEAAHEFEEAYATHPHPLLLHNIYLARRDLGDIPGAVDALSRYLATATDLSASDRRLLEGRLTTMQHQLPVQTTPDETPDTTPDETPTVTDPIESDAPDAIEDATPTPTPAPIVRPTRDSGIGILPGAIVVGIGGAALVGAAIAGGVALGVQSDRDAQCTLPGGACPASLDQNDYASRFAAARDAGWGLLIVGAATAAIGGVLFGVGATSHGETPPPTVSAACDANGCTALVAGHF